MGNITGHWSKYGGGRYDLHQTKPTEDWYCQSCSQKQPLALEPYMYEVMPDEYIKICSVCVMSDAYALTRHISLQTTKVTEYSKTYGKKVQETFISTATLVIQY